MVLAGKEYFELAATVESGRQAEGDAFRCSCCNSLSLGEAGGYEICDVCGWEDDPVQELHPNEGGGANGLSLNQAKENLSTFGVSEPELARRNTPPKLP